MKKFTEILSFILTAVFIVGGLFLAIGIVEVITELFGSSSTGFDEFLKVIFMPLIIVGLVAVGLFAISAIGSGLTAFFLIKTANKKFDGDENKTKRIIIKCIAYGLLIATVIQFAKFFS